MKKTVLTHARELYGVAFASSAFAPARVTSCNSLPLFGPWFTDYNEQVILINLLKEGETLSPSDGVTDIREHGWPTAAVQRLLMQEWGWMHE